MAWFIEDNRSYTQKIFAKILKNGQTPSHVAIIMDGNRRYAKINKIEQIKGHISGFDKLAEVLNWCFTMDIREVTVYAFSIENFKRSRNEVDDLFKLAKEKFEKLLSEIESIKKHRVCIKIFGDLSLLPKDLQELMLKVIRLTKNYDRVFLNVCFAYTAREEMTLACREICDGLKIGSLKLSDIDEDLINKCLYTSNSTNVDLLVRTSGEIRLSDFMLWQSSTSTLSFVEKLWPEFSIWNFYVAILYYQLNYDYIKKVTSYIVKDKKKKYIEHNRNENNSKYSEQEKDDRVNTFLHNLFDKRLNSIQF